MFKQDIVSVRKRLKVVSACNECRRKKTKCNGEKPCSGCIKHKIECKYNANTIKNKHISLSPVHHRRIVPQKTNIQVTNNYYPTPAEQQHQKELCVISHTIQSIEGRLGAIEDVLYTLLHQKQTLVQPDQLSSSSVKHEKSISSSLAIQNLLNKDSLV